MQRFTCIILLFLATNIFFGTSKVFAGPQQKMLADSLNLLAKKNYLKAPALARQYATEALSLSKTNEYQTGIGTSLKLIGASYWAQSYYPTSIFFVTSAIPFLKGEVSEYARCLGLLSRVYADMHNFNKADSILQEALDLKQVSIESKTYLFTEQSMLLRLQKKYAESLEVAMQALQMAQNIKQSPDEAILTSRIFSLYIDLEAYDMANQWYPRAIATSIAVGNKRLMSSNYIIRSNYFRLVNRYDSAIYYANLGLRMADKLGIIDLAGNATKNLYKVYEAKGDKNMALTFYKKYQDYQDTLNEQTRQNSFTLMEDFSEFDNKLFEIDQLKKSVEEKSDKLRVRGTTIDIMAVYIALLMTILIVTFYLYSHIKKLNTKLLAHNDEILAHQKTISIQSDHLQKMNGSKDRLLGIIGHDLKTPINNIKALIDIFHHGLMGPDELQMVMKDMGQAVHAADLTLANLVKWSESQQESKEITSQPVDVAGMANETKKIFEYQLRKKNLQLEFEIITSARARANENHLKAILNNLISNAIKFTPAGGYIGVKAYQQNETLVVEVKDTGKGMHQEEIDNLFKSTTHFTTHGTNGEKGTGIGLLLCHELVSRNAGKIWVNSMPGQGSTFYLSLPACEN